MLRKIERVEEPGQFFRAEPPTSVRDRETDGRRGTVVRRAVVLGVSESGAVAGIA